MTEEKRKKQDYLTGKFLIALPSMQDPRFEDAIIYCCGHDNSGAMGLIVNKLVESISFRGLLDQLEIEVEGTIPNFPIHFGGPLEVGRGFVLHTSDYQSESSVKITDDVMLTATIDILKDLAFGKGPQHSIVALGYSGWSPGQLENELQKNDWLEIEADISTLFKTDIEKKRDRALQKLGIDPSMLSTISGRA